MKKRTNKTINKAYYVLVDFIGYTAKLTPCSRSKDYNSIVIKNSSGKVVHTDIKRNYLTVYEIISTWAVKSFPGVKRLTIIEQLPCRH